jgi:hypothetical protein
MQPSGSQKPLGFFQIKNPPLRKECKLNSNYAWLCREVFCGGGEIHDVSLESAKAFFL